MPPKKLAKSPRSRSRSKESRESKEMSLQKLKEKPRKTIQDWSEIAAFYKSQNKDPTRLWKKYTSTYSDLIHLNMLFLQGKISETPYYMGNLYGETIKQLPQLLELHKDYGVITIDSQPGMCTYGQKVGRQKLLDQGKTTYDSEQRSYLGALLQNTPKNKKFVRDILMKLDETKFRVAVKEFPETKSSLNFINFDKQHNMTRSRTYKTGQTKPGRWSHTTNTKPSVDTMPEPDEFKGNARDILQKGSIGIFISSTVYCDEDENVTNLLLELLQKNVK
jgi:hypothetical protein